MWEYFKRKHIWMGRKKGSFTVEAVFVVPVCLLVLFFILQALFYVHHVSWYTAAAWDCALTQMQEGPERETADSRWQSIRRQQPLPVSKVRETSKHTETQQQVRIDGAVASLYGLPAMQFQITAKRGYKDPVDLLRKARQVRTLAGYGDE